MPVMPQNHAEEELEPVDLRHLRVYRWGRGSHMCVATRVREGESRSSPLLSPGRCANIRHVILQGSRAHVCPHSRPALGLRSTPVDLFEASCKRPVLLSHDSPR